MDKNSKDWILCINCYKLSPKGQESCSFCGFKLEEEDVEVNDHIPYEQIGRLGLILSILSFFIFFISPSFALTIALMSVVLVVLGNNIYADKYGILISTFVSIMSTIFISTIILLSDNQSISYTEIMVKETIGSSLEIENNKNKVHTYNTWFEENGTNLLILNKDGTFIWYNDQGNLNSNYASGVFQLSNGSTVYDRVIYDDGDYFYYNLTLTKFDVKKLTNIKGINKEKQEEYYLKLRKDNNQICLENVYTQVKTCFLKDTNVSA